jgi:hypothetical protein
MARASGSDDPRLEETFALVRREAFMPPGPWKVLVGDEYVETPSADPAYLYQNTLVALDAEKGINNGAPFLHARWIGAVAPKAGEMVTHVGAGTGYYSAVLSMLVLPGGSLTAYEIDNELAKAARRNLAPLPRDGESNDDVIGPKMAGQLRASAFTGGDGCGESLHRLCNRALIKSSPPILGAGTVDSTPSAALWRASATPLAGSSRIAASVHSDHAIGSLHRSHGASARGGLVLP